MSEFKTDLCAVLLDDDKIWALREPLVYDSDLVGLITVPAGFQTDFASVPRVPVIYTLYGDRAHRESVIHDYLYRIDAVPNVSFDMANEVFKEAMTVRGKPKEVVEGMYWGVCMGGRRCFHKLRVGDKLI